MSLIKKTRNATDCEKRLIELVFSCRYKSEDDLDRDLDRVRHQLNLHEILGDITMLQVERLWDSARKRYREGGGLKPPSTNEELQLILSYRSFSILSGIRNQTSRVAVSRNY